jgi:hypothetical protein
MKSTRVVVVVDGAVIYAFHIVLENALSLVSALDTRLVPFFSPLYIGLVKLELFGLCGHFSLGAEDLFAGAEHRHEG